MCMFVARENFCDTFLLQCREHLLLVHVSTHPTDPSIINRPDLVFYFSSENFQLSLSLRFYTRLLIPFFPSLSPFPLLVRWKNFLYFAIYVSMPVPHKDLATERPFNGKYCLILPFSLLFRPELEKLFFQPLGREIRKSNSSFPIVIFRIHEPSGLYFLDLNNST